MTTIRPGTLLNEVEKLLSEKKAVSEKEKKFLRSLDRELRKLGYQVIRRDRSPLDGRGRQRRRRRRKKPE